MGVSRCEEGSAKGTEDLKAYVDKQVASLRKEILALLEDRCKKVAPEVKSDEADVPVSAKHLDQQDAHELCGSIWDCSVMVGFDCLGPAQSCFLFLLIVLNFVVQLYFCYVVLVGSDMLEDDVSPDVLHALLRYRTGVAHRVENANVVSRQSLLRNVCDRDERLPLSGLQRTLHEDLSSFQQGGWLLCVLALLCWSAKAISESGAALRFAQAVLELRGQSTRVVVQAQGGVAIESLGRRDVAKSLLVGVLPRLGTALLLFYTGTLYLSRTSRLEDLLLNAMALAFVLDVDELFFEAFAPHRVKTLLSGLAPLHLTPHAAGRPWLGLGPPMLRLLGVALVLVVVHELELRPFHGRIDQALHILCSGELDFVYGISPATGGVEVARSSPEDTVWPAAECAVLHFAQPKLREAFGWNPQIGQCSFLEASDATPATIRPIGATTLERVDFSQTEFDHVSALAKADVEQAGVNEPCANLNSTVPSVKLIALQEMIGGTARCEDLDGLCHLANMTRLRTLCATQCQCHFNGFSKSGIYKSTVYGCPARCYDVASELELAVSGGISPFECEDAVPRWDWKISDFFSYMDENKDGQIGWSELDTVYLRQIVNTSFREELWSFDVNDDLHWNSSEQEAFKEAHYIFQRFDRDRDGNLSETELKDINQGEFNSSFVDVDGDGLITKREMARGNRPFVYPPWTRETTTLGVEAGLKLYLRGLFEVVHSKPNFQEILRGNLERLADPEGKRGILKVHHEKIAAHFTNGGAEEDWASGNWVLAPGVPHPGNLQLCAFLTSFELKILLGIDVCNPERLASLRLVCPRSCGCQAGTQDCPSTCPRPTMDTGEEEDESAG